MKYLIDTHVAIRWIYDDHRLEKTHARVIERAQRSEEQVGISAFSLWEAAKLAEHGRLGMFVTAGELLENLEAFATVLPLTSAIALESTRLGARMHGDPADQVIVATARCHALTLLTSDRKLIESGLVTVA